jgi:hypothetical protein
VRPCLAQAAALGWRLDWRVAGEQPANYKIWVVSDVDDGGGPSDANYSGGLGGASSFRVALRVGDDAPCAFDGSWYAGAFIGREPILAFSFDVCVPPRIETRLFDAAAYPHRYLKVMDTYGLARRAPSKLEIVMLQLDAEGECARVGDRFSAAIEQRCRR